jgi:hypothetical protein
MYAEASFTFSIVSALARESHRSDCVFSTGARLVISVLTARGHQYTRRRSPQTPQASVNSYVVMTASTSPPSEPTARLNWRLFVQLARRMTAGCLALG